MASKPRKLTSENLKKIGGVGVVLASTAVSSFIEKIRGTVDHMDSGRVPEALETLRTLREPESEFSLWDDLPSRHALGRVPMWSMMHAYGYYEAINSFRAADTFLKFIRELPTWKQAVLDAERLAGEERLEEARKVLVSRLYPDYSRDTGPFKFGKKAETEPWHEWRRRVPQFDLDLDVCEWSRDFSPSKRWMVLYVLYQGLDADSRPARWMCLTLFSVRPKGWVPVRHDFLSDFGSYNVSDRGEILVEMADNAGFRWSVTRHDWARSSGRQCGLIHSVNPQPDGSFHLKGWTEFRVHPGPAGARWEFVGLDQDLEFRKNTINDPYFHLPAGMNRDETKKFAAVLERIREESRKALEEKPDRKAMRWWRDYTSEALALIADLGDTQAFPDPILLPRAYQRRETYYADQAP